MRRHLDENRDGLNEDITKTEEAFDDIEKIFAIYNQSVTINENFLM